MAWYKHPLFHGILGAGVGYGAARLASEDKTVRVLGSVIGGLAVTLVSQLAQSAETDKAQLSGGFGANPGLPARSGYDVVTPPPTGQSRPIPQIRAQAPSYPGTGPRRAPATNTSLPPATAETDYVEVEPDEEDDVETPDTLVGASITDGLEDEDEDEDDGNEAA